MHRVIAAVAALALILGLAPAVAASPESAPSAQAPEIQPFTSAHFGMSGTAKIDGVTVDILGEGDLAPPDRQRSSFKFGPFTAEVIMVGSTVYTRTRFEPRWSRQVSPQPVDIGPLSGSELTQLGADTRFIGNEQVNGVTTRHYTSALDLSPLLEPLLPAVSDRDVRAALRSLNGTVDVWIGAEDQMLRQERLILSVNLPSIEPNGDPMTGTIDLTIAYSRLTSPSTFASRRATIPARWYRRDRTSRLSPAGRIAGRARDRRSRRAAIVRPRQERPAASRRRPRPRCPAAKRPSRGFEHPLAILVAQHLLVELADARARQVRDEDDVVGQPPLRERRPQEVDQLGSRDVAALSRGTTQASGRSAHFGCGTAMTQASATAGWPTSAFSRSMLEIHSPPLLTRSLVRSAIWK